jgi:urea-proton symporter
MGWLYLFMGVVLGSAVVPIALCITWSKANKWGCIGGSIAGLVAGLIAWLVTTATLNDGVIDVVTTGGDFEMLAGNLASIGVGGIVATVCSYIWPEDFDWESTRAINANFHAPVTRSDTKKSEDLDIKEKDADVDVRDVSSNEDSIDDELDPVALDKAFRFASWSSIGLFVVLILLIPLPLFFASTVYTARGLAAWVSIGIARWALVRRPWSKSVLASRPAPSSTVVLMALAALGRPAGFDFAGTPEAACRGWFVGLVKNRTKTKLTLN